MQFGTPSSFQMYATNGGSNVLTRSPFTTPGNVMDEIRLARSVTDADDDVRAVVDQMVHSAYRDGMENHHPDLTTVNVFNAIAKHMNLDLALKEMLREYVIAAQVVTLSLFTRSRISFNPTSDLEKRITAQMSTPMIGVLPAENVRVLSNDVFSTGELAYDVTDEKLKEWLEEFFAESTTPARKNRMREEQPVISAIFTGKVEVDWNDQDMFAAGKTLYKLNPRMVHRTTMPKGSTAYPHPRMTSNFALLEAKRLLNIMDYSLLQGGTNYIVVAKVGSDALPAQQPEVDNLTDEVRHASRTGVLVGDHRISIDIITPDLKELLNPAKRKLIGRKLAMAILSIPEQVTPDPGNEGARGEMEFAANTITADRHDIKRHVERFLYDEIVRRNPSSPIKTAPTLWHARVILSGLKDFFDNVVKARDRGDIPRKWAVEVLGFPYEAGVAQRQRELDEGHDEIMTPGSVPFTANDGTPPNDTPEGRPRGSSSDNGRPGARRAGETAPSQRMQRRRGEPVRAEWDQQRNRTVRLGELTAAVIEEHPEHTVGRVTQIERDAVENGDVGQHGNVCVIPVNPDYQVRELRAFRLQEGLSMIVGQRFTDDAIVAKALCFREPQFDLAKAEETALRWGFVTSASVEAEERAAVPSPTTGQMVLAALQDPTLREVVVGALGEMLAKFQPQVTLVMPEEGDREVQRGPDGEIVAVRMIPRQTGGGS